MIELFPARLDGIKLLQSEFPWARRVLEDATMTGMVPHIGTASWNIPALYAGAFPSGGSHLERYARRLNAVEINSSFYRSHRRTTYERWAGSVPGGFRFSVKMPRAITHDAALRDCTDQVEQFLAEAGGLGDKLGVLLAQLPPRARYQPALVADFCGLVASKIDKPLALEPRHASWFGAAAEGQLRDLDVARVAADPPRAPGDGTPGGCTGLAYYRLHGSPKIYYSSYGTDALVGWRACIDVLLTAGRDVWCILDNTAAFAATANALALSPVNPEASLGS